MSKDKTVVIKVTKITPKQWSNLLIELNLVKKAWKPYNVEMTIQAPSFKKIIDQRAKVNDYR